MAIALVACSTNQPVKIETNLAMVTIHAPGVSGLSTITTLDGEPVVFENNLMVTPGIHQLGVACRLTNGIGTSFAFDVEFEANLVYCFKALKPVNSCTVVYAKAATREAAEFACRNL